MFGVSFYAFKRNSYIYVALWGFDGKLIMKLNRVIKRAQSVIEIKDYGHTYVCFHDICGYFKPYQILGGVVETSSSILT